MNHQDKDQGTTHMFICMHIWMPGVGTYGRPYQLA